MREDFKDYLTNRGYATETPSGLPSTVCSYEKAIDYVCKQEGGLSWRDLADRINHVGKAYDVNGPKERLGNKSHRTVFNALKQFEKYIFGR